MQGQIKLSHKSKKSPKKIKDEVEAKVKIDEKAKAKTEAEVKAKIETEVKAAKQQTESKTT